MGLCLIELHGRLYPVFHIKLPRHTTPTFCRFSLVGREDCSCVASLLFWLRRRGAHRACSRTARYRRPVCTCESLRRVLSEQGLPELLASSQEANRARNSSTGRPAEGRSSQPYRFGGWRRCVTLTCKEGYSAEVSIRRLPMAAVHAGADG